MTHSKIPNKQITPELAKALEAAEYAPLNSRAVTDQGRSLVDYMYQEVLKEEAKGARKNKRGKGAPKFKRAVEAFVGELLTAQRNAKAQGLVYLSSSAEDFSGKEVSHRSFKRLRDALEKLGLLEQVAGPVQRWTDVGSRSVVIRRRASRWRATPALMKLAATHGIDAENVRIHFVPELPREPLQLRARSNRNRVGQKIEGKIIRFPRSPKTIELEKQVHELNEFLAEQDIRGGVHRGYIRRFNNGDDPDFKWNMGGRLYSVGGGYQQMDRGDRLKMTINGEPVAEIDIRASYLTIFLAWHGKQIDRTKDPYVIEGLGKEARKIVKGWFVATFGKGMHFDRWPRDASMKYREETGGSISTDYPVRFVREQILKAYPLLSRWGTSKRDGWASLMFHESVAVIFTMLDLKRDYAVPSLSVHDSLIVPRSKCELAANQLMDRYEWVTQVRPALVLHPKMDVTLKQRSVFPGRGPDKPLETHKGRQRSSGTSNHPQESTDRWDF
jgi:hypothetical protein